MKEYNVNLTKRYTVEFIKDDVVYKKGWKGRHEYVPCKQVV